MRNLISADEKHLLYKDERGSSFLLTEFMEIYRKSETTLGCYCWSFKTLVQLRSKGIIFCEWSTADGLYIFETNNENLYTLIQLGAHKRRIHKKGKFLKSRELKLGHRIIPYNPNFK